MFAELIAIFSAMGWAADSVLVRLGLRQSNIFAAMLVSYVVSAAPYDAAGFSSVAGDAVFSGQRLPPTALRPRALL